MLGEEYKVPTDWQKPEVDTVAIVDMVNKKADECEKKQWKIKFWGKEVGVRHVFEKILGWVQTFAAIGDTIVQYDPVHAALPWAGFRFLLQVSTSHRSPH
jgi:hypothetical protein